MDDIAPSETVTLVTGATGFLGRHLVAALAGALDGLPPSDTAQHRHVHVAVRQPDPSFEGVDPSKITVHPVDLGDAGAVDRLLATLRPTELFHLAWFSGESASRYADPANHDWVAITEHLVESFGRNGGRRAVLAGSCIEYGPQDGVLAEDHPPDPVTVYGRCKLDAGLRALAVGEAYENLDVAVARIFFALGRFEEPNRLVPHIIGQLMADQPAELSAGAQRRDYLHAWDVALGLIAIADSPLTGFVNVGMGEAVSVKELAQIVGQVVGRPDLLWFGARPGGSDGGAELAADISLITSATGWHPQLDLGAAAADVVKWWSEKLGTPAAKR